MLFDIHQLRTNALKAAQEFIGTTDPLAVLGWGVSGFVFLSPDLRTAIKVHHYPHGYVAEVKADMLLKQHRVTSLHGLTIPKLRNHSPSRNLIQIDFVSPPYLLDFAGVKFSDPDFSADTMDDIHATIEERFGKNADIAYAVYHSLLRYGIYYLDLRQSNLNLEGLPGIDLSPEEPE